jgi:hypothetical protein
MNKIAKHLTPIILDPSSIRSLLNIRFRTTRTLKNSPPPRFSIETRKSRMKNESEHGEKGGAYLW